MKKIKPKIIIMRCFIFISIFLFVSCKIQVPKEKIRVIEDITLGNPQSSYQKEFDSLEIPNEKFLIKDKINSYTELIDNSNYYNAYYTKIFDLIEYKRPNNSIQHLGLITPIILEGTPSVFALLLNICHTEERILNPDKEKSNIIFHKKYITQSINNGIIEKIKKDYIVKYGEPKRIDSSTSNTFWQIRHTGIEMYKDDTTPAITYVWETEYYTIKFFTGMTLNNVKYSTETGYFESIEIQQNELYSFKNQEHCKAFAYLYYELNKNAIEKIGIKNKKI